MELIESIVANYLFVRRHGPYQKNYFSLEKEDLYKIKHKNKRRVFLLTNWDSTVG